MCLIKYKYEIDQNVEYRDSKGYYARGRIIDRRTSKHGKAHQYKVCFESTLPHNIYGLKLQYWCSEEKLFSLPEPELHIKKWVVELFAKITAKISTWQRR